MAAIDRWLAGGLCLVVSCSLSVGLARGDDYVLSSDHFDAALATDAGLGSYVETSDLRRDWQVRQTQATSDRRSPTLRTASRSTRSSRVPYMIGDSPYGAANGGHQGIGFGGLPISNINHPVFGGMRQNISEAGTFLPNDRFLFSYRHLHNTQAVNILDRLDTVDQDRFLFGLEKTFCDGMASAQVRLPVARQLDSYQDYFVDSLGAQTDGRRNGEFGNMSVNLKLLLTSQSNCAVSTGLGINIPTADDATIMQSYDTDVTINSAAGIDGVADLTIDGYFANDTVNLVPYVAWYYQPRARLFHQGFLQIDVPLNGSDGSMSVDGTITPDSAYAPVAISTTAAGEITQPTLLRANMGLGYWLMEGRSNGRRTGVAALLEVHYTTSFDDANSLEAALGTLVDGGGSLPAIPLDIEAGAGRSRTDVVNLSTGLAIDLGSCLVTNGFILPISDHRYFDFEYNLQVNRRF